MKTFHKTPISLIAVSILVIAIASCSSNSPHSQNTESSSSPHISNPQPQAGPAWTVKFSSSCANGNPDSCMAGYGFSVSADGSYSIGPGPENQKLVGQTKAEELAILTKLITPFLTPSTAAANPAICVEGINETNDSILFKTERQEREVLHSNNREFCYNTITIESSKSLYSLFKSLTSQYYPIPFPRDSCATAVADLEGSYGKMRGCTVNQDCSYFDDKFNAVGSDTLTFLAVNDCSPVKPMLVGNHASVLGGRDELVLQYQNAIRACGEVRTSVSCNGFAPFQPTVPAPICDRNICKGAPIPNRN